MKCRSTGTEMLYGRFATSASGSKGNSVTFMASAEMMWHLCPEALWSRVCLSRSAKRLSNSITASEFTFSNNPRVNEPSPGPISTTLSLGERFAAPTILRMVFGSITKFWPSFLVGLRSSSAANLLISPEPSSSTISCPRIRRPQWCFGLFGQRARWHPFPAAGP